MEPAQQADVAAPEWTALPALERRVLGVLVEKAKTTPDQYPLSVNALMNGCNQKSNRDPKMEVVLDDIEDALESLRERHSIGEVVGGGRVPKYRHYLKDWMGVDGTELAVMAELLLRGSQTIGELRGRAARMANGQLADLAALRPVLNSLISKGLAVSLTPEGRGQIVTHGLYEPAEMESIRGRAAATVASQPHTIPTSPPPSNPLSSTPQPAHGASPPTPSTTANSSHNADDVTALRGEVVELRAEVAKLTKEVEDLWSNLGGS